MLVRKNKKRHMEHPWRKMGYFTNPMNCPSNGDGAAPLLEDMDFLPIQSDEDIIDEYKQIRDLTIS